MSSGSLVSSASRPPCGIEKGLWLNSTLPASSSSNIGKSTIQQKRKAFFSRRSSSSPRRLRTWPASFAAASALSQEKKTASPSFRPATRSEEHTSELQSLMRISYAVFCLKKTKHKRKNQCYYSQLTRQKTTQ